MYNITVKSDQLTATDNALTHSTRQKSLPKNTINKIILQCSQTGIRVSTAGNKIHQTKK